MTKSILTDRIFRVIKNYNALRVARFSVYMYNIGLIKWAPQKVLGRNDIQIPYDQETKYYCPASAEEGAELLRSFVSTIISRNGSIGSFGQGNAKLVQAVMKDLQPFSSAKLTATTPIWAIIHHETKKVRQRSKPRNASMESK